MSPVKVPQHLDLEDVLVWGLGAVDLLVLATAGLIAWWLWLAVPSAPIRVAVVTPIVLMATLLGPGSLHGRTLRDWLVTLARYRARPRRRVFGGKP
jgi:hypothetical protein